MGKPKDAQYVCSLVPDEVWQEAQDSNGGTSRKREAISFSSNAIPSSSQFQRQNSNEAENPTREAEMVTPQQMEVENNEQDETIIPENNDAALIQTNGEELLTTEIVGRKFLEYVDEIWGWLADDVLRIGIHGMAGVGKTEVAMHINNKLLQLPNKFHHVYWVTVSPNCSIHKLQITIGKSMGLDLSDEDDVKKRAARLSKAFTEKKKSVLILDDVWECISLQDIGITANMTECSLIITTRSLDVCRQINCLKDVKVEPLLHKQNDEDWKLFLKVLGVNQTVLSNEVEEIARSIVEECEGLPLEIITMARHMRGVDGVHRWRSAVEGCIRRQAHLEIFQKLEISYHYLKDPALQQFFLYSAIFFHECYVELIEYLIAEEIIQNMKSRVEQFEEGDAMVNVLENANLLYVKDDLVCMHSLIKSMAFKIMEESRRVMVQNGKELKQLPDKECWTEDLTRVSLMYNEIETIPSNCSPNCPNLSSLLMSCNRELRSIGDSFFKELQGLKFLDLSYTKIKTLPSTLFSLVNLTALLLNYCSELRHVQSLANLTQLKKLDLSFSGVEEVPEDLELLSKLVYLDLWDTKVKKLKEGILWKLSNLQVLSLPHSIAVKGKEITFLKNLDILRCRFYNLHEFNACFGYGNRYERLDRCNVTIGSAKDEGELKDTFIAVFKECSINEKWFAANDKDDLFLQGMESLEIVKCQGAASSLSQFSPLKCATYLSSLLIKECDGIECLLTLSQQSSTMLESLEYLRLDSLEKFNALFGMGDVVPSPLLTDYGDCFSHLKEFIIKNCPTIRNLFPSHFIPNLRNLQTIEVGNCSLLQEIIATADGFLGEFFLPELTSIKLTNLPELKKICEGNLICSYGTTIYGVSECPMLDNIPVYYRDSLNDLQFMQQVRIVSIKNKLF